VATWGSSRRRLGARAARGRAILVHFGVPLGYLATVRGDGGPRVHPFCPIVCDGRLYGLIGPSPKQRDLVRDGRFALHSFPLPERDDEFYLTGRARLREEPELERAVRAAYLATGGGSDGIEKLFELDLEHAAVHVQEARRAGQLAAALRALARARTLSH
jgi:hypothetical protein